MNALITIIAAVIVAQIIGFLWYGPLFSKTWLGLVGLSEQKTKKRMEREGAKIWTVSVIMTLVLAAFMTGVYKWTAGVMICPSLPGLPGFARGTFLGGTIGVGVVLTTMGQNYLFVGKPLKLYLIDGLYHVVTLVAMGAIVGAMA